jgi:uncharacterized repeat protein (TIGR01451 family)
MEETMPVTTGWNRSSRRRLALASLAAALFVGGPAAAQPVPSVSIVPEDFPAEVLIGETFTFTVEFSNQGDQPGAGPYIALCLPAPGADGSALNLPCDGFSFVSAVEVYTGQTRPIQPAGPPLIQSPPSGPIACQGLTEGSTNPLCKPPIPLPPGFEGCQVVFLPLRFTSFYPGQPPVRVQVTLQVHSFADPGKPLPVKVIGGFQSGSSGTGCLEGDAAMATTVPTLFKVRKRYLGPEDETATGPNFPQPYKIEVDVADGQTVDPLLVTEDLPDDLIYLGPYDPPVVFAPPPGFPNGQVVLNFGKVTGTASDTDASFSFKVYAADKDANGHPVLDPRTCKGLAVDDVRGTADWTPLDPRDKPGPVTSDVTPEDHRLALKCLAVQKNVTPLGPYIPGDELVYTVSFQVSDYVQARNVVVTDILSDGLLFLAQPAPTLTFADKNGAVQGVFALGTDAIVDESHEHPCGDGATVVRFDISKALATLTAGVAGASPLHQAGILTGGEVGPVPPSVAATGTITFHVRIADQFNCRVPSGEQSVDKHDRLTNRAAIAGEVLELAGEPGDVTAEDDSFLVVAEIAHGTVDKSIVARNGDPSDPLLQRSPPLFAPGDTVTFRLSYCFPSTDAEDFRLEDFLPSPVFDASQVTGVTLGPNDQLGIFPTPCPDEHGNVPPDFVNTSRNSVCFFFGSFNDPENKRRCAEILFTVPVTDQPFADNLVPTNMVSESERNSFKELFSQTRVEPLLVGEPVVRVSKGAVSACCSPSHAFLCTASVGTFSPPVPGPVPFSGPFLSCGIRFMPPLTSAALAATPIRSDVVGGVQAGDRVLFALVVENTGSSPRGAFDVRVKESLPPGLTFPPAIQGGIALCVEDGAGNPLPYNLLPGGLFGSGIELVDPGPAQGALDPGAGNTTGSNLAVITYALDVAPSLAIGACAANHAAVASYAGTEGGPSHVAAGLGGPLQQSAEVCRKPALVKSLAVAPIRTPVLITSEPFTQTNHGVEELTIGEIARFRLVLEVPEGTLSNLRIEDQLPGGFTILPGTVRLAFVSSQGTGLTASALAASPGLGVPGNEMTVADVTPAFPTPPAGLPPTVDQTQPGSLQILLGDLTNAETDCDREFVVIEFNALVGNDAVNQRGGEPVNAARVRWDGQAVLSNPLKLRIVEPRLRIDKDMREQLDNPQGQIVALSITNDGAAISDAFDVVVTDELPESLCFESGSPVRVLPADGVTVDVSGKKVEVRIDRVPAGGRVDVVFPVFLCGEASCEATINAADVTWTSLPGPNGTVPNITGSVTPGASGAADGERNGDGGAVNTYHDRDVHSGLAHCPPDLALNKVCNSDFVHFVDCTIVVTNLGPGPAESVMLSDVLPPDTQAGFVFGTGWSCTGTQVLSCTYDHALAPGEQTAKLLLEGLERGRGFEWPLIGQNCARVITQGDENPANDFDCDGACPDPSALRNRDAVYLNGFVNGGDQGVEGGFLCTRFDPDDFCSGIPSPHTPFKGDCGCGCLLNQKSPDIAVTKACPATGPGLCQIVVQNVGEGPAVGTLTITDTLAPGVRLLKPVAGTNWRCDVTDGEPTRVTCTWEGPPLAAGQAAPPLSLRLVPREGTDALPRNCARATLVGDADEKNNLGCTQPPNCPKPSRFIHYVSEDPSVCVATPFQCDEGDTSFSYACGCGCICLPAIWGGNC